MGEGEYWVLPPDHGWWWGLIQKGGNSLKATNYRKARAWEKGEWKTTASIECLEKEILGVQKQLSQIAKNVAVNDQQPNTLDADIQVLRKAEQYIVEELACKKISHNETKEKRKGSS